MLWKVQCLSQSNLNAHSVAILKPLICITRFEMRELWVSLWDGDLDILHYLKNNDIMHNLPFQNQQYLRGMCKVTLEDSLDSQIHRFISCSLFSYLSDLFFFNSDSNKLKKFPLYVFWLHSEKKSSLRASTFFVKKNLSFFDTIRDFKS